MMDLIFGALILLAASALACAFGMSVAGRASNLAYGLFVLGVVAATFAFALLMHGRLVMARWLPFSNVLITGNWIPIGAAVLVGALLGRSSTPIWRRAFFSLCLAVAATYAVIQPFLHLETPAIGSSMRAGVFLQSSNDVAASA